MISRKPSLKTFTVEGGLRLYAVSPADAQAEAFANQDGQVYFGKGKVTLKEGKDLSSTDSHSVVSKEPLEWEFCLVFFLP